MGCLAEECAFRKRAVLLHLQIKSGKLRQRLFALADRENVNKVGHRLRIVRTRSARKNDRRILTAVGAKKRDPGKVKHIKHGGIAKLILKRECDNIEIPDRVAAVRREQRYRTLPHLLLHVGPRRIHSLAPYVVDFVQHSAEYPHAEIRHTDLIYIGEAERDPQIDL